MSKTQVAVRQSAALVVSDKRPDYLPAVNAGPARGSEDVTIKDLIIPRLDIVQALSPYRKKGDPKFVEGATEGDLINSLTLENYGTAVLVVPVIFKKEFLVWKDRKDRAGKPTTGGFFGAYATVQQADERMAQEADSDPQGVYSVVDTPQNFCFVVTPNNKIQEIVVSMAKSKSKASRKWNSLVRLNEGDRFSRVYQITSVQETGKSGDDYHNFDVATAGYPAKEVYQLAEMLYTNIKKGAVNVTAHADDEEEASDPTPSEF